MNQPDDRLHGEESIIQRFLAPLAAGFPGALDLKDDCAAFTPTADHELVVKTDPVAAGIHFFPDDPAEDIGWKALAVNVSDLAAKAAVPRAYLMALSFPDAPAREWMQRFASGLGAAQAAFGMHLIGGDTDRRSGPVTISITVLGEVPAGRMVRRATAKAGDLVFVSGTLGTAAVGLMLRRDIREGQGAPGLPGRWHLGPLGDAALRRVIGASLRPEPRLGLRTALARHASAAMDISDGLAKDLGRMGRASGVAAEIELEALPLDPVVRAVVAAEPERWLDVVAGGDDYEILAAVPPGEARAFAAAAREGGVPVACIGAFAEGEGIVIRQPDGTPFPLARTGWDHF